MKKKSLLTYLLCSITVSYVYADTYVSTDSSTGVTVLSNKPSSDSVSYTSDDTANSVLDNASPVNNTGTQGATQAQSTSAPPSTTTKSSNVKIITTKSSSTNPSVAPSASKNSGTTSTAKSVAEINSQIKQINKDLSSKQIQKQQLDSALKGSQDAINKTAALLKQLKAKQDSDLNQISQLQVTIPQITASTTQAKDLVAKSTAQIYGQLKLVEAQKQSILSGNDSLDSARKQEYLIQVLKMQNIKYKQLNDKLNELQSLNIRLQDEVNRISKKLDDAAKQHQNMLSDLSTNKQKSVAVQQQIQQDQNKVATLKQRQEELNALLKQLSASKQAKKTTSKQPNSNSGSSQNINMKNADQSVDDNSPFMSRTLVQPVSGEVSVGFGQMRDSVKNNGILLKVTDNSSVFSITNGVVLFSGDLPGFGNILVIDHGDNYTSVYSGIVNQLPKGTKVSAGQRIASTGTAANQPMGGFYFELRHLGKAVNPTKLFAQ